MTLDPVHGLQSAFRSLMRVMAYPGTLCDISSQCAGLDLELGFPRPLLVLALTLLDAETRFAVLSAERPEHESLLSRLTFARRSPVSAADFVFVAGPGFPAAEALLEARIGTLVDPHLGATIVMEAASLSKGEAFELSGPGIELKRRLQVDRDPSWAESRAQRNREYPLGLDLVIADPEGRIAALPRTTRIVRESR